MKTYKLYWIQGYEFYDKEKDMYMYYCDIEVIAKNEKDALKQAKTMIQKKEYRVKACYERIDISK